MSTTSGEDTLSRRRVTKRPKRFRSSSQTDPGSTPGDLTCKLCHSDASDLDLDLQLLENVTPGRPRLRTHYFCLLFSSGLHQNGSEDEGLKGFMPEDVKREIKRGNRLKCVYCKQKGATVGCAKPQCKKSYHLPCGVRNKSLQQHFDQFKSFCNAHRPSQKVSYPQKAARGEKRKRSKSDECPLCLRDLDPKASFATLFAPCCKNWVHRTCLQKSTVTDNANPFSCPHCNDSDVFYKEMSQFGIYIPQRESVLEGKGRDDIMAPKSIITCSAKFCVSQVQDGRSLNEKEGQWQIQSCQGCKSKGIHTKCGGLDFYEDPRWYCYTCRRVVRFEEEKRKMDRPVQEVWGTASAPKDTQKSAKLRKEEIMDSFRIQIELHDIRRSTDQSLTITPTTKSPVNSNTVPSNSLPKVTQPLPITSTFRSEVEIIPVPMKSTAADNDHMNVTLEDLIVNGLNSEYGRKCTSRTAPLSSGADSNIIKTRDTGVKMNPMVINLSTKPDDTCEVSPDSDYESAQEVSLSSQVIPYKMRKTSNNMKVEEDRLIISKTPATIDSKLSSPLIGLDLRNSQVNNSIHSTLQVSKDVKGGDGLIAQPSETLDEKISKTIKEFFRKAEVVAN